MQFLVKKGMGMKVYKASKDVKKFLSRRSVYNEQTITDFFVDDISTRYRSHAYKFSQKDEGKKSGADFYWIIITDQGVFQFLIQAKKAESQFPYLSKSKALYNDDKQIDMLIGYAEQFNCIPFYFLYSNNIKKFECIKDVFTEEGVFLDSAYHFKDFFKNNKNAINILPLSCLFSHLKNKCQYIYRGVKGPCVSCGYCLEKEECGIMNSTFAKMKKEEICTNPFIYFLRYHFNIDYLPVKLNLNVLLFMYADSVFARNPKLVPHIIKKLNYPEGFVNRIIISDYLNRHSKHYLNVLLGDDCEYTNEILSFPFIIDTIKSCWKQCKFIKRIGVFGSYSRNEATEESDVDIVIEYHIDKMKRSEDLSVLLNFLVNVIKKLKKNVDYIDYIGYKDSEFLDSIRKDIIWIKPPINKMRYRNY